MDKSAWDQLSASDREILAGDLNRSFGLAIPDARDLEAALAERLNALIRSDFHALVTILYRVDVDEGRLRNMLSNQQEDAALIMARLILERTWQKIQTRRQFSGGRTDNQTEPGDWS